MTTHTILCNKKNYLINKLKKILDYRNIGYSDYDIESYNIKELKILIKKYDIIISNADNLNNFWYGPRKSYLKKSYNFIKNKYHPWYRTYYF